MKYEIIYDIIMTLFGLSFSGYLIYIGIRQIKRVPFIIRGISSRAARVLPVFMIFSSQVIGEEFDMFLSVTALCLMILFFIFLYIDYKKFYQLYIYNIDEETLEGLLEQYFEDKGFKYKLIDDSSVFDSFYNEIRIYKSKSKKNIGVLKSDFEKYINHMKCKKFRVMGLVNILFGLAFLIFIIHILIKFYI
ncbi:hypothetical protein [Oceanirhabdus seepicola]|uniref:Uncharacterized protein n=1 Tax=Oceanirhabdus seepicola TaxID=2828781 RepID=A0A9J6NYD9_9CLOT|nr:hypothetical protein [Oceanirhabdus seepicola]MCM1989458.1 hypothetical protein [Oceanirhabdus seepicola]